MREEPRGYYIYAYLDGDTPFYIGKGIGDRAYRHLRRCNHRDTFFYRKLNKMVREGREPGILVIKDNLAEARAYEVEADLIWLVGTRILGTGPLCNTSLGGGVTHPVTCWGEKFSKLRTVSKDDRCAVPFATLRYRVQSEGWTIEEAAETANTIRCWGEKFSSLQAISKDARCNATYSVLTSRMRTGAWTLEYAAEADYNALSWGEKYVAARDSTRQTPGVWYVL